MARLIASLLAAAALVAAPSSASANSCPPGFHLHAVGDGDHGHSEHQHVGLSMERVDLNGNGDICVKHLTPEGTIHVHIDDIA
jgi:Spy/CpxP family protein refolding chaperone